MLKSNKKPEKLSPPILRLNALFGGQPACALHADTPAATTANLQNNLKTASFYCSDGRWPSKIKSNEYHPSGCIYNIALLILVVETHVYSLNRKTKAFSLFFWLELVLFGDNYLLSRKWLAATI